MNLQFARYQYLMSRRLSKYPVLGYWISRVLGTTNVGQYARATLFKKLVKKIPINQFSNVLDLGCGQGEYSFMLSKYFPNVKVTSLDIEEERIKKINSIIKLHRLGNIVTHLGPIESIPNTSSFDFIYSIDVFEHIKEGEMPFKAAYRKLKQNGYLLVKMPNKTQIEIFPSKWFKDHNQWLLEEHVGQVYTLENLVNRMKSEGFRIIYASYWDGPISRLSWELGYLFRKKGALIQLLALPLLKGLIILDRLVHQSKKGNSIQVIGQKI
jgi:ubiquinone/menaquinone biosynthesis C-methylase UbiE